MSTTYHVGDSKRDMLQVILTPQPSSSLHGKIKILKPSTQLKRSIETNRVSSGYPETPAAPKGISVL